MIHKTPRDRRRQAARQRIICGAMTMVQAGGLDALSIHGLAKSLDYSPAALYRYFDSKDALIAAVTHYVLRRFGDVGRRLQLRLERGPLSRLLGTLLVYRDLATVAPQEFGLLSLIIAEPRTLVPDPLAIAPVLVAVQVELAPISSAADAVGIERAENRSLALFALTHGLLQLRKVANRLPNYDFDEMLVDGLRSLLVGWGVSEADINAEFAALNALGNLVDFAGGLP